MRPQAPESGKKLTPAYDDQICLVMLSGPSHDLGNITAFEANFEFGSRFILQRRNLVPSLL
jgi:hypothetical protein